MPLTPNFLDCKAIDNTRAQERGPDDRVQGEQPQKVPFCGDPAPELHAHMYKQTDQDPKDEMTHQGRPIHLASGLRVYEKIDQGWHKGCSVTA